MGVSFKIKNKIKKYMMMTTIIPLGFEVGLKMS